MAKGALNIARVNLANAKKAYSSEAEKTLGERASVAAQVAMAAELNRIANALWALIEKNAKK